MLAWLRFGNGETPETSGMKGDHLVGKYYVEFDKHYKEEVCLRGDAFGVNPVVHVVETYARGFEDEVVFVEVLVVAGAFHEFQFFVLELVGFEVGVPVCHGERHVWEIFANEAVGGDALFAEAEDDDLFAFDGVYDVIS